MAKSLAKAPLLEAVAEHCAAWECSADHHRALLKDLQNEPPGDWPAFTAIFKGSAAAARAARETKLGRAA